MKNFALVAIAFLAYSQSAIVSADQIEIGIPQINKYYTDYNYVVAYSSPAERNLIARYAGGMRINSSFMKDERLRAIYEIVKGLLACELSQDPKIIRGNRLAADFLYAKIPLSISGKTRDHLSIRTLRQEIRTSPGSRDEETPHALGPRFNPREGSGLTYVEVDYWTLINGKWLLSSLHFYPLDG